MKTFSVILKAAAGALALACVACASTPPSEEENINLYVDPETGRYSVDDDASDEAKALADVMNMLSPKQEPAAELTDEQIWRTDASGNQTHIQSGLMCPVTWSGMPRDTINIFKRTGEDVGCSYSSGGAVVSYYAYRNGGTTAEEVEQVMDTVVTARHPVFEPYRIESFGSFTRGKFVHDEVMYEDTQGTEFISGVGISEVGGWRLKVRYTYPLQLSQETEAFIGASLLGQQDSLDSAAKAVEAEEVVDASDTI